MAQTGYSVLSIYYSSTAGNTPSAGNLVAGELAINTADGKLFYKDSAGVVQVIAGKGGAGVAGGSNTQVQYNSSGSLAGSANMTFDGTNLTVLGSISTTISGKTAQFNAAGGSIYSSYADGTKTWRIGSGIQTAGVFSIYNTTDAITAINITAAGQVQATYDASISGLTVGKGAGAQGSNTVLGNSALAANTSGGAQTAIGYGALQTATSGGNNTAVGFLSMNLNTTGGLNTAIGQQALYSNTTASYNTAVGYQAGYSNTTSGFNTFLGYQAGNTFNYTGGNGYNCFIGSRAGTALTTGQLNCFVGDASGLSATTGNGNTFIGQSSGNAITTGGKNTIIGAYTGNQGGLNITTASNYIVLSDGDGNPKLIGDNNGSFLIGSSSYPTGSSLYFDGGSLFVNNNIGIGNSSGTNTRFFRFDGYTDSLYAVWNNGSGDQGGVQLVYGATSWTSTSDARLKNITGTYTNALADISQLQPVKFTWKSDTENKPQVGVLAQSVQTVVPEAIDHIRVDKEDETDYLGVRYTELIPLLVASIQELKAEVDSLKAQLGK